LKSKNGILELLHFHIARPKLLGVGAILLLQILLFGKRTVLLNFDETASLFWNGGRMGVLLGACGHTDEYLSGARRASNGLSATKLLFSLDHHS
jgi:hypothetical protein